MKYFKNKKNVDEYIKMADGYDGKDIIEKLKKYLPDGSTILELGMGPGKDLDILKQDYSVTGSDNSKVFLDMYRNVHPEADLMNLDAIKLKTERNFDCIYSNKVLHHLTRKDLKESFINQAKRLNPNGVLCHTLWYGDTDFSHKGLSFAYYTEETIKEYFSSSFEILLMEQYRELEKDDSLLIVLKLNS